MDSPRPGAENFLLYIEKKIRSAPGRDRSKGGFSAPERRKFSPLYRDGKSVPRPGAIDPKVDSPRPSVENFSSREEKSVPHPGAIDPKVDSPRPSVENFSSREEKSVPHPGAIDPKVDSPRPSAETPRVDLPRRGAEDPPVDHVDTW